MQSGYPWNQSEDMLQNGEVSEFNLRLLENCIFHVLWSTVDTR